MVSCSASSTLSTYAIMLVMSMAYSSSHACVGAPGEGGLVVYPWSPCFVTSGRLRPVLGGAPAGFVGRVVAPQGVGQVCPGRPPAGRVLQGGHFAGSWRCWVRGVACCVLGSWWG